MAEPTNKKARRGFLRPGSIRQHVSKMWGCLLSLQGNALDDIAGRALDHGVLAEDLREESLKLGAFHATICVTAMPRPVGAGQ